MKSIMLCLCLLPLALAGCASDEDVKPKRLCPQTAFVRELERVNDYGADTPDEKTLVATALMKSVDGTCKYTDEGVDVQFRLEIKAGREPRLGGDRTSFPFFVSIVAPDGKILSKELMTADFTFSGDGNTAERAEDLHVFIPLPKDANVTNYRILMGFQLTEEQLNAVRKADHEKGAPKL